MVNFGNEYWSAMNRNPIEEAGLSTKDIGISLGFGDAVRNALNASMAGATTVELSFTGAGKGDIRQGGTPETYGKTKREDIRQLAKINDMQISTHASLAVTGLAGMDQQGRSFSQKQAQTNMTEIKKAIDFAADACGGGAVVAHTGEFPTVIGRYKEFEESDSDEEMMHLANKETGEIMSFRVNQKLNVPKWQTNNQGKWIDAYGNSTTELHKRIPVVDEKSKKIIFEEVSWNDIQEKVKKMNQGLPKEEQMSPAKYFFIQQQSGDLERTLPFAHHHYQRVDQLQHQLKEFKKLQDDYSAMEQTMPKEHQDRIKRAFEREVFKDKDRLPKDMKASEFIKNKLKDMELDLQRESEGYYGYSKQIQQLENMKKKMVDIEEEGVRRSAHNIARLGMYAYDVEQKKKLKRDLFIAPENLFPETGYGAHPEELKKLILESRKNMTDMLVQKKNMDRDKAQQVASNHIKATFDVAHANLWRKYFKGSDEDFNKWMNKQIDNLNKDNIIGHAHLSDNFGYSDEHLTIGEGNAPVEDFVKKLKDKGFKGAMIAEPGAQGEAEGVMSAMTGAWARIASSPMYRIDTQQRSWNDLDQGYFGRTGSPTTIVGPYVPSKEWQGWWSEAPIE
ncbi:MAG: TIM barrel protein [archaeon]